MLKFNSALLFSEKPKELAKFYQKVFGYKPAWSGGDFVGFDVGGGFVGIGRHDKVSGKSKNPERLMLGFEAANVQKEFERIKGLGAKVVQVPYHPDENSEMSIATFSDPDGNYFQIQSKMKM